MHQIVTHLRIKSKMKLKNKSKNETHCAKLIIAGTPAQNVENHKIEKQKPK